MPQYLTPGVYVEEVESGIKPIAGVGTSTAGFIGEVADDVTMPDQPGVYEMEPDPKDPKDPKRLVPKKGPNDKPIPVPYKVAELNTPRLITSWEQFKNNFGDFDKGNKVLAHSVYGFFNNGGTRCWISRVKHGASTADIVAALDKFRAIDEIAIVAVPGALDKDVQNAVLDHCENEYLQDRFAIFDGQRINDLGNLSKATIQGDLRDSSYGAIYYPWIKVYDPVKARENDALRRADPTAVLDDHDFMPPSGFIAGVYARVDGARGVHKAPANEVIRGASDVEVYLTKADQAGLNPHDINVIRKFDGNITIWGAHTLAGEENAEWRYINVRRLFLFVRESIDEGTQWVVFEPNDRSLWAKIVRNVTAFLTLVWRDGALFGSRPEEAFYVRCDDTTNPPEVRDLGRVIIEIGLAVVKPAEFVIFRISQWAGPAAS
jgi:phage tail sheath protein FI